MYIHYYPVGPQGAQRDGKGFEICTAGLEFESGRAPLVRAWDSRGFTRSPRPTKCAFRGVGFPRIQKKKLLSRRLYFYFIFFHDILRSFFFYKTLLSYNKKITIKFTIKIIKVHLFFYGMISGLNCDNKRMTILFTIKPFFSYFYFLRG